MTGGTHISGNLHLFLNELAWKCGWRQFQKHWDSSGKWPSLFRLHASSWSLLLWRFPGPTVLPVTLPISLAAVIGSVECMWKYKHWAKWCHGWGQWIVGISFQVTPNSNQKCYRTMSKHYHLTTFSPDHCANWPRAKDVRDVHNQSPS